MKASNNDLNILTASPIIIIRFFKYFFIRTLSTSFLIIMLKLNVTSFNKISESLASILLYLNNFQHDPRLKLSEKSN